MPQTEIVEIDTGSEILEVEVPVGMSQEDIIAKIGAQKGFDTQQTGDTSPIQSPSEKAQAINKELSFRERGEANLKDTAEGLRQVGRNLIGLPKALRLPGAELVPHHILDKSGDTPTVVDRFAGGVLSGSQNSTLANVEDVLSNSAGVGIRLGGERYSTVLSNPTTAIPKLVQALSDIYGPSDSDKGFFQVLSQDVPSWRDMTLEERAKVVSAADLKHLQKEYPAVFKPGTSPTDFNSPDFDPVVAAGYVGGVLADPTTLIPGGAYTKAAKGLQGLQAVAHMVRQGGKLSLITGTLTASDVAVHQLAKKGVIDPKDVGLAFGVGAVLGVAAPVLIAGGYKGIVATMNKVQQRGVNKTVNAQLDLYETTFNKARVLGKDVDEAQHAAQMVSGLTSDTIVPAQEIAKRSLNLSVKADLSPAEALQALEMSANRSRIARKAADMNWVEAFIEPIHSRLKDLSPSVARKLRAIADSDSYTAIHKEMQEVNPFFEKVFGPQSVRGDVLFKRVNTHTPFDKAEQLTIKEALANQNYLGVIRLLVKKDPSLKLMDDFDKVVMTLERVHKGLGDVGYTQIKNMSGFFPRAYKNLDHISAADKSAIDVALSRAAASKKQPLTAGEREAVVSRVFAKQQNLQGTTKTSSSLHKRKIPLLSREQVDNLIEPAEALHGYLRTNIMDIQRRKFLASIASDFGVKLDKKFKLADITGNDVPKMISKISRAIEHKQKLDPKVAQETEKLLLARFTTGEMAPHGAIQKGKNIMNTVILGNPVAAATQLGDLVIAGNTNGYIQTLKTMFGNKIITNRMMGLIEATEELYGKPEWTKQVLNSSLKNFGFTKVDNLGKSVLLTGALQKARKEVATAKGTQAFVNKWGDVYGDELPSLIKDLRETSHIKDGEQLLKSSDNIRHFLWSQLADVQPISLSEMPLNYLKYPNGRTLYMLKSFGLKSFDRARRLGTEEFAKGNYVKGVRNMAGFATAFALGGASVDTFKKWVLGGFDGDAWDEFPDNVFWNMAKLMFVNKFTTSKAESSLADAIVSMFTPPINSIVGPIDEAFEITASGVEWKHPEKLIGLIPGVGKPIVQVLKEQESQNKRKR